MSGFSAEWLELREPVDHAARNEEIVSALCHYFLNDRELIIADIGGGTGSTLRALRPIIPLELNWHILDSDPELIVEAKSRSHQQDIKFTSANLANTIAPIFEPHPDLITSSAFLDLVSYTWLELFVSEVTSRHVPFYGALSYDGRTDCNPSHHLDGSVLEAFNRHQQTDKGFGAALGPDAAETAERMFREAGYTVFAGNSDWEAGPVHNEFLRQLLQGWHDAACETDENNAPKFGNWLSKRMDDIDSNRLNIRVGHRDILAVPPENDAR